MLPNLPRVTKILLIANIAGFALQWMLGEARMEVFELWPLVDAMDDPSGMVSSFMPWQLVTSGFMHGDFWKLFFNILAQVMFAAPPQYVWGARRFTTYYFGCLVGAALCHLVYATWALQAQSTLISAVGASGAVYGFILAYGMLFPNRRMVFFPIPVTMTARTVAILFGALALFYGVTGSQAGVGHVAHLGGMLVGWLLIRYWRGQAPFGGRKPKPPSKRPPLRIVR